jgi:Tfp pilus assembly protein PilX
MRFLRPLQLVRREEGIALVMSLGLLLAITIAGATALHYTTANERSSNFSKVEHAAFNVAEAGLNDAMALLSNPTNNPMNPWVFCTAPNMPLPCYRTSTYEGGVVTWGGTLDEGAAVWSLTMTGMKTNPTGVPVADTKRVLTAKVPIQPAAEQANTTLAWNYVFSYGTGDPSGCDMTFNSSVELRTRVLVSGNLCMRSSSRMVDGDLLVAGQTNILDSATIGAAGAPIDRVDSAGGCKYQLNPVHIPCQGPPANADKVWAETITTSPQMQPVPNPSWENWYLNANPGPYYPCQNPTGPVPVFENEVVDRANPNPALRNRSVPTDFNLTPNTSYTCKTAIGEISWDNGPDKKLLTVKGTIFIDGDMYITQSGKYTGQANLYLSGSFKMDGSMNFCAARVGGPGTECNYAEGAWNPNDNLLTIATNGTGGQTSVNADESMVITSSTEWQGALFGGPYKARADSSLKIAGPIIADEVVVNSSIDMYGFAVISEVIPGMPGNATVFAQPRKPELFSG